MKKFYKLFVVAFTLFAFAMMMACTQQGKGFALPDGDKAVGKANFLILNCNECHSVGDIAWKGSDAFPHVPLGGKVTKVKTYGELLTSIINPSHKIEGKYLEERTNPDGSSKMINYNEIMSVQELVDIVTFLESEYEIDKPPVDYYTH